MLGKCPYCEDGYLLMQKKIVQGRNTKIYTCSNAKFKTEDGELFESVGTCSYRIWGNSLLKYGKRGIGEREIRELLSEGVFTAVLHSRSGVEYKKYVVPHEDYGISVLFEDEVAV